MDYSEIDLARLAMCIDCEGSIVIDKGGVSLWVTNTSPELINWLENTFGFSKHFNSTSNRNNPKHKICCDLYFHGVKAVSLLKKVEPYLIVKKDKVGLAESLQSTIGNKGNTTISDEVFSIRESITKESKEFSGTYVYFNEEELKSRKSLENQENIEISMDKVDLARLAMCIDCEGSITFHASSRTSKRQTAYSVSITIGNTDLRLIQWLRNTFGFTVNLGGNHKAGYKPIFIASIYSKKASKVLSLLLPYFLIKKERAELAVEFQKTLVPTGKRVSEEVNLLREKIYTKSKNLRVETFSLTGFELLLSELGSEYRKGTKERKLDFSRILEIGKRGLELDK